MSMIYECPNCHMPQMAGRISCRHCGAEFETAVPDDAFHPDGPIPEPRLVEMTALEAEGAGAAADEATADEEMGPSAAAAEPVAQAAAGEEAEPLPPQSDPPAPPLSVGPPPAPAETLPYQSSPYPAPTYQPPPTFAGLANTAAPLPPPPQRPPPGKVLTRVLLTAFPLVLALVLGAVFFARSLDSGQDAAPTPLPAITPAPTPTIVPASPGTPAAPPYVLNGALASTGADEGSRTRRMVGRWESKNLDFYVFNENKMGTRGSLTGKGPQGAFLWTLVQNHLILYGDKQEQLTYTQGPDEDTMFLRGPGGGKYVQYARTKTEHDRP